MDALGELSGSSSGSDDEGSVGASAPPSKKGKPAAQITFEDLQQHGMTEGPSVLYVPPPNDQPDWAW